MINFIDITCEDHLQEVLKVQQSIHPLSGSPTPSTDPVIESSSRSITSFEDIDLLLEEVYAFLALDSIPPYIDDGIFDSEGDILFLKNLLKDKPSKAEKSMIYTLIGEPPDTFLMGDEEIKFNPLKDIDDLIPIPRVSETPLDSIDFIMNNFDTVITNPLFEFNIESTFDNPLFEIQTENSDEEIINYLMETIMDEVQINRSLRTAHTSPPFDDPSANIIMHDQILT
ncbi:hypothetical protein Tco_0351564 [Tanacetum coccineum]